MCIEDRKEVLDDFLGFGDDISHVMVKEYSRNEDSYIGVLQLNNSALKKVSKLLLFASYIVQTAELEDKRVSLRIKYVGLDLYKVLFDTKSSYLYLKIDGENLKVLDKEYSENLSGVLNLYIENSMSSLLRARLPRNIDLLFNSNFFLSHNDLKEFTKGFISLESQRLILY